MRAGSCPTGRTTTDLYRTAAHYVDKILKGRKARLTYPYSRQRSLSSSSTSKAAKQIGLTIPGRVLERANQVIK